MSTPNLEGEPPGRVLALGDVPPRAGMIEREIIAQIADWLRSPGGRPCLWVHGPAGSGRTTSVAAAIRLSGGGGRHVKRVACFAGISIEEVLDDASNLLRQTGIDSLARVLDQRAHCRSKVAVLLQTLQAAPFVLWIDDADQLGTTEGALDLFLEGCRTLDSANGRLLIVSQNPPPSSQETIQTLEVDTRGCAWIERLSAESTGAAIPRVSADAWGVLQAAAVLPPEPSRQALREVSAALGVTLELKPGRDDDALRELEAHGLITLAPLSEGDSPWSGPPAAVPSPVRRFVEERLQRESLETWKALQTVVGTYFLRLASSTGNLWHFVAAWRAFLKAELRDESYEIQKAFLQDLIQRGCFDVARHVIEATVRTSEGTRRAVALGNLAILHKNAGDYAHALELYGQVRDELIDLGDSVNSARVLHQIGNTQYLMGDLAAAVASYEESLELSTQLGDRSVAVATRIQIANVQFQRGERDLALDSYLETLADARVSNDRSLAAAVETQIGQIHFLARRYVEADAYLKDAESDCRGCGDLRSLVKVLEAQGMVARERREYDLARSRYEEAFRAAGALGDGVEAATALVLAGDVERLRLQLADSLRFYKKAKRTLDAYAAGGAAVEEGAAAVKRKIAECIDSLATDIGHAAFERLDRITDEKSE
jgi:tetratricopeptide (TPR) repeat protein